MGVERVYRIATKWLMVEMMERKAWLDKVPFAFSMKMCRRISEAEEEKLNLFYTWNVLNHSTR